MSTQRTVVIIDDDPDSVKVLEDRFRFLGYHVMTFSSALEYMSSGAPYTRETVILIDNSMPRLTGVGFAECHPERLNRIIVITSNPQRAIEEAVLKGLYQKGLLIMSKVSLREIQKAVERALLKPTFIVD